VLSSVAIYARYSTDRQDARSIDDQVRRCREWAAARSLKVVAEHSDAAVSGAHMDRAGMRRLLEDARARRFTSVLVDDLSRLSRDLGNTWRIIFEDLAGLDVRVIDCTTGMASDGAGARLTFGALALVNDTFLQLVKTETHRGLEGRAIAGFWTGGRVYGYRTEREPNPPDPEHPRAVVHVDPAESATVRRIFESYAEGASIDEVAHRLNAEAIPAPYDGGRYAKRGGRGWARNSIKGILTNERYVGRWTWNKRKFMRAPGKRHRRAVIRPQSEWRTTERPELALVSAELWGQVQTRLERRRQAGFRKMPGESRTLHALSGLLRCGACGATMIIVGSRKKNGSTYYSYGCSAFHNKGAAICGNSQQVSERKLETAIFGALRETLSDPDVLEAFRNRFEARVAAGSSRKEELGSVESELRKAEQELARATEALLACPWSETVQERLRQEDTRVRALRERRGALQPRPVSLAPAHATSHLKGLSASLNQGGSKARAMLLRHLEPVRLTVKKEGPDRQLLATGALNLEPHESAVTKVAGAGSTRSHGQIPIALWIPLGRAVSGWSWAKR
jgi:site-specific DNA recombinase